MIEPASHSIDIPWLTEPHLARLAEEIAFITRAGDVIALCGGLGAGKTTFARAFIAAMTHPALTEVVSPTFTLVQTYETPRFAVAHYDLYRVSSPLEIAELGLQDAVDQGIALIEWPGRLDASQTFPSRLDITVKDVPGHPDRRDVTLTATTGSWLLRLARILEIRAFLAGTPHSPTAAEPSRFLFLQGDASVRRYARLSAADGKTRLLMDWPRQPDGPPVRDGKPYSRIAHLAEDVRPFVAIGEGLAQAGLRVPTVEAADTVRGLLLLEDFGDGVLAKVMTAANQAGLWEAATDALVALRRRSLNEPARIALHDGGAAARPALDRGLLEIETELVIDWYWPLCIGTPAPPEERDRYHDLWSPVFDRLLALPKGWMLRDYHSPNLIQLKEPNVFHENAVGIIDFQDAIAGPWAYDLVSLLQDARVDVPPALEAQLFDRYCAAVTASEPGFDRHAFGEAYAMLGAQRNAKILGIFARLAQRDDKPAYLAHIPRIWRYLARDLESPPLAPLKAWFDRAFALAPAPEQHARSTLAPAPEQHARSTLAPAPEQHGGNPVRKRDAGMMP